MGRLICTKNFCGLPEIYCKCILICLPQKIPYHLKEVKESTISYQEPNLMYDNLVLANTKNVPVTTIPLSFLHLLQPVIVPCWISTWTIQIILQSRTFFSFILRKKEVINRFAHFKLRIKYP